MTTSTLSIIDEGMAFTSTKPSALAGWKRIPSTSTRVRLAPSPRMFNAAVPGVDVAPGCTCWAWVTWLKPPAWNWGSLLRVSSTSGWLVFWKACEVTVTIGLSAVKSRRAMRDPVTTTSPTVAELPAGGVASWARALAALNISPASIAVEPTSTARVTRRSVKLEYMPAPPLCRCERQVALAAGFPSVGGGRSGRSDRCGSDGFAARAHGPITAMVRSS